MDCPPTGQVSCLTLQRYVGVSVGVSVGVDVGVGEVVYVVPVMVVGARGYCW